MLYNMVTGYYAPKVPKLTKNEIIVVRCLITTLAQLPMWFLTDGQANDAETGHFNNLDYLDNLDWNAIQKSDFSKSDGNFDRARRYQAEFLVYDIVPVNCIESICVYDEPAKTWAENYIENAGLAIPVLIHKPYFFD